MSVSVRACVRACVRVCVCVCVCYVGIHTDLPFVTVRVCSSAVSFRLAKLNQCVRMLRSIELCTNCVFGWLLFCVLGQLSMQVYSGPSLLRLIVNGL